MLSNRTSLALCLGFLAVGILIGGTLEAAHHHNRIHLTVMPWQEVNVSPEVGDVIDWTPFDQSKTLTINFSPEKPCTITGDNICKIDSSIGPGVYLYDCVGTASCPDPGVGPGSSTSYVGTIQRLLDFFDKLVVGISRFLGFSQTQNHRAKVAAIRTGPEAAAGAPAAPGAPTALGASVAVGATASQMPQALTGRSGPSPVSCAGAGNPTTAQRVSGSLNQMMYWTSSHDFTLAMSSAVCSGDTSAPDIAQQCTLLSSGTYTATEPPCLASAATDITVH